MCELNYLRCSVNEQLVAAGNEILVVLDQSQKPCGVEEVKVFVKERLAAAAGEILVGVERVLRKYKQNINRYRLLDIALKPYINLHRADAKQILVCKQAWSPSLNQEEPELPHIKVEQEELWTSQEGEQLQGLNETDIKVTNPVFIQSESDYREEPSTQSVSSDRSETKTEDGDDDWKEPGLNTLTSEKRWRKEDAKQLLVCKRAWSPSLDQKEPELTHIKVKQELWTSQEGEQLQGLNETDTKVTNPVFIQSESDYREEPSTQSVSSDLSETKTEDRALHSSVVSQPIKPSGSKPKRAKSHFCQECGKGFSQVSKLQIHQRVHTGEKPYHCQLCGRSFSQLPNLQRHQRVHTGEKPYHCQQCGRNFSQFSKLQTHQRVHTGERPYQCLQCGKSFTMLSSLQKHLRVHTGEKPYNCQQCGKRFSCSKGFKRHKWLHARDEP